MSVRSRVQDLEPSQWALSLTWLNVQRPLPSSACAAGKDGAIKHVMSGMNPQGCQVCNQEQNDVEKDQAVIYDRRVNVIAMSKVLLELFSTTSC